MTSFPVTWLPPPASYSLVGSETHSICKFSFYSHFQVTSGQMTTSGSLSVTWGHVTSFPVTWRPTPASYSEIHESSALCSYFHVTSGQIKSLPGRFWSAEVMWLHFLSLECLSCELQPCRKWNAQYTWDFWHLQPFPGNFRSNDVTCGHLKSRDVTSCHVTASSCELQPFRKWNTQYRRVFGILHPLPGDFRSKVVTSGSLPVTWGHVMSFPVTRQSPNASYSLVGSKTHSICEFLAFHSPFHVTFGQITSLLGPSGHLRSRDVISCHVTASLCELQSCRKWNAQFTQVFGLLQPFSR